MLIKKTSQYWLVGVLLITVIGGFIVVASQKGAPTNVGASSDARCQLSGVRTVLPTATLLDTNEIMKRYHAAAGQPDVYATVAGKPIYAYVVEYRVAMAQQLQQLWASTASVAQPVTSVKTANQQRNDIINNIIDDMLLLQAAQAQHMAPSPADVAAEMQQQLRNAKQLPENSLVWNQFVAYLCANSLTETTFLTDPRVVAGYTHNATVQMMRYQTYADLTPEQMKNQSLVNNRIQAYIQQLRQQAAITVTFTGA